MTAACDAAGVSTSAYYQWAAGDTPQPTEPDRYDARLIETIRAIHSIVGV